jgi:hypothetical protein
MLGGQARADRLVVSISDIEMGPGGPIDDFPASAFLAEVLASYSRPPFDDLAVDLVLNGDTFDLLKTPLHGHHPVHVTAEIATAKLNLVLDAHPDFARGVEAFLAGRRPRRVFFVVGNHDQELLFPEVQEALRARLGGDERVQFPGFGVAIGDALIEHGSQADDLFRVNPDQPFVLHQGRPILALPWGAVALLEAMMPLQQHLHWADRLKPRALLFEHLPELREVLVNAFWSYWTSDYWRALMAGDPLKNVSWTMLRQVAYRFASHDPDIGFGSAFQDRIASDGGFRVRSVGHSHQAGWWSYGDRKLLTTGCYRDEFMVGADGEVGPLMPKVHAEIYQRQGRSVRSHLVEVDGPQPPDGCVPQNVTDQREQVAALLGTAADRQASARARQAQEDKEAADRTRP